VNIALDTNAIACAEGVNGETKRNESLGFLQRLSTQHLLIPAQVLGELFAVLTRKANRTAAEAKTSVIQWADAHAVIATAHETIMSAADLVESHQFSFWDAVILSAAAQAQCRLLLSPDMHDGFTWRGTTVANPYAPMRNPILLALL
jgi:predicted nucleic acid-binding protein